MRSALWRSRTFSPRRVPAAATACLILYPHRGRGELIEPTQARLTRALAGPSTPADSSFLDLSDVSAIDATSTDAILQYSHWAHARGIQLILEDPSPIVRRALARRSDQT